jgi:hypothetical protein
LAFQVSPASGERFRHNGDRAAANAQIYSVVMGYKVPPLGSCRSLVQFVGVTPSLPPQRRDAPSESACSRDLTQFLDECIDNMADLRQLRLPQASSGQALCHEDEQRDESDQNRGTPSNLSINLFLVLAHIVPSTRGDAGPTERRDQREHRYGWHSKTVPVRRGAISRRGGQ